MIKRRVHFFKNDEDDYGHPIEFRSYLIMSRKAEQGESANLTDGRAKVYTLSHGALPLSPEYVVAEGGAENAMALAIERLKILNDGFNHRILDNE